jgi:hypothetical protein
MSLAVRPVGDPQNYRRYTLCASTATINGLLTVSSTDCDVPYRNFAGVLEDKKPNVRPVLDNMASYEKYGEITSGWQTSMNCSLRTWRRVGSTPLRVLSVAV